MCGIAGLIGVDPNIGIPAANTLLAHLQHRGPDDVGIEVIAAKSGQVERTFPILIHSRLSVLDLSQAGHQPMRDIDRDSNQDIDNWIVFNGTIYNFRELKEELSSLGFHFQSQSDTEVILKAYRAWGCSCLNKIRGMFAWCLVDGAAKKIWLCRDRLGIKPLYLLRPKSGGLVCSSELRSLCALNNLLPNPCINPSSLEVFFAQGAVMGADSIISEITMLEPATSLELDWSGKTLKEHRYWRFPHTNKKAQEVKSRQDIIKELTDSLRKSVEYHLVSDAPLGVFLSGGLDSAVIASLAKEIKGRDIVTVTVGFPEDAALDETREARKTAEFLGTDHHEVTLAPAEIIESFSSYLNAIDQPTVDGFNTFLVAGATKKLGLKVALSGLGGDELFGGYATFQDIPRVLKWRALGESLQNQKKMFLPLLSITSLANQLLKKRSLLKIIESLNRPLNIEQLYFLRRELFLPEERKSLLSHTENLKALKTHLKKDDIDLFNQISKLEINFYMRDMLLRDSDVFSMAQQLEIRVPFLDHIFAEKVLSLPGTVKSVTGLNSHPKQLLREMAANTSLKRLSFGRKQGFTLPWRTWLCGPLRSLVELHLKGKSGWDEIGVNPETTSLLFDQFLSGDRRISPLQILSLVVIKHYVSRNFNLEPS